MSDYAPKSDLKSSAGVDTSVFAIKVDLTSLKPDIDKLGIDKLETALADLSKPKNVVEKELVKNQNIIQIKKV